MTDVEKAGLFGALTVLAGAVASAGLTWFRDWCSERRVRERLLNALTHEVRILVANSDRMHRVCVQCAAIKGVALPSRPTDLVLPDTVYRSHAATLHLMLQPGEQELVYSLYEQLRVLEALLDELRPSDSGDDPSRFFNRMNNRGKLKEQCELVHDTGVELLSLLGRDVSMYVGRLAAPEKGEPIAG